MVPCIGLSCHLCRKAWTCDELVHGAVTRAGAVLYPIPVSSLPTCSVVFHWVWAPDSPACCKVVLRLVFLSYSEHLRNFTMHGGDRQTQGLGQLESRAVLVPSLSESQVRTCRTLAGNTLREKHIRCQGCLVSALVLW